MKKWFAFAVLVLGLSVLTSGGVRPEGVAAYKVCEPDNECVHEYIAEQALALYSNEEINAYWGIIGNGAGKEDVHDHVWDLTLLWCPHYWDADKGALDDVYCVGKNYHNAWLKAQVLWGMALGEYQSGDKTAAFDYLGHVAHLLADMTVPAHTHEDMHWPDKDWYEEFMTKDTANLSQSEKDELLAAGPVEVPDLPTDHDQLYYLFYTTNQVGDFYGSNDAFGDSDDPEGSADFSGLENIVQCRVPILPVVCDLFVIRRNTYLYSIRAEAALYELFAETTNQDTAVMVVIDSIKNIQGHGDNPDYYVKVRIGSTNFRNEGNHTNDTCDECTVDVGWAFAENIGPTDTTTVEIELWDEDDSWDPLDPDDFSDINPLDNDRALALTVDLAKCAAGEAGGVSGDVGGACGETLTSWGKEDDRSQIWFRILPPNAPPTADAGIDQTVDEGDLVTLNGAFSDFNGEDTHTFLWHLESSTNGQVVPDATTQSLTFTPGDNGAYTFSFTVTDNHGAQGSDTVVVTAENVPPVVSIDSIHQAGMEIGADVDTALTNTAVDVAGSFTDVGAQDTHTVSIDWGDGHIDGLGPVAGSLSAAHTYTTPCSCTITLTVTDDDTGVGTATRGIEVVDAAGAIVHVSEDLAAFSGNQSVLRVLGRLIGEMGGLASDGAVDLLDDNPVAALQMMKLALQYLEAAEAGDPSLNFANQEALLALAARSEAIDVIEDAEAMASGPNDLRKIGETRTLLARGDELRSARDYVNAVDKYGSAVRSVLGIR